MPTTGLLLITNNHYYSKFERSPTETKRWNATVTVYMYMTSY